VIVYSDRTGFQFDPREGAQVVPSLPATTKADQPRLSRGWRRMQEIARESEVERRAIEAELLVDLGRPPTAVDRIAIETLSAAMVRTRRLRGIGKNDTDQMRLIVQLLGYQLGTSPSGACSSPARATLFHPSRSSQPFVE
jgi:hypothetical protein